MTSPSRPMAPYWSNTPQACSKRAVSRINVSLDTLDADRFSRITHGGKLQQVLDGLAAADRAGAFRPIKINMLVMRDVNDDEVIAMTRYCINQGFYPAVH